MRLLRQLKRNVATLIGIADLDGRWDEMTVMHHLSALADFCVVMTLRHLLWNAAREKRIRLKNTRQPEFDCGLSVIALGKWGAQELNYSSDIDLMVVFDPDTAPVKDRDETQNFFTRLTRELARILDQPTGDGYAFRTDLRLRPDPGAMPLAVSISATETYYSSLGQNWERAAMIKARPVVGDKNLAHAFMGIMQAWIWRRNLDFAAIQDIHSIKRQINTKLAQRPARKSKDNPFLNFNVKLGHGGIREIEFFAQTQQLIFGGREPSLRNPDTLGALAALTQSGHITAKDRSHLQAAYLFLRKTEHRLQMREDRQTHSLPATPEDFENFADFMGFASAQELQDEIMLHTAHVRRLYAHLFTESENLSCNGNLVFTGVDDDPETLATLLKMKFKEPEKITAAVRGWHHGRYRAVRSERARQILTELTPRLLQALAATPHPDAAFIRFDRFLSCLPSGIPIFSMFARNPPQMELVADIMGASPALAEYLGQYPSVLEGVISRDFFGHLPTRDWLQQDLSRQLENARDYQDILDYIRRWAREKRFHAGIHMLKCISPPAQCGLYFANIAETALCCLVPHVEKEFAQQHGAFKSGTFGLLGMGSLAARYMFTDSDLDLVAIYTVSDKEKTSNGKKPLPPTLYYTRLMQRIIAALSAPTAEGTLYNIDTRLRPSGESGPLAVSLDGLLDYYRTRAWTWEIMSLIRARPVYGPTPLCKKIEKGIAEILSFPRDEQALLKDISDMRKKVEKQFGSKDPWNLRTRRGGWMDVMFVTHFLLLRNAEKNTALFHPDLKICLQNLRQARLISAPEAKALAIAHDTALALQGFLRLTAEQPFIPAQAAPELKNRLRSYLSGKKPKKMAFSPFAQEISGICKDSYRIYTRIFGKN